MLFEKEMNYPYNFLILLPQQLNPLFLSQTEDEQQKQVTEK